MKLSINGTFNFPEATSVNDALLRLSIRFKQMSDGIEPVATEDGWEGTLEVSP